MTSKRKSRSRRSRSLSRNRRRRSRKKSTGCGQGGHVVGVAVLVDSGVLRDGVGRGGVQGTVVFREVGNGKKVLMDAEVSGLRPGGVHAIHLHEAGDMRPGQCAGACAHWDPQGTHHGGLKSKVRHVGDFGNLEADTHGVARVQGAFVRGVKLRGKHSIMGRSVVIHALEDDLGKGGTAESLKTGSAGARIACGVVGYASDSVLYF